MPKTEMANYCSRTGACHLRTQILLSAERLALKALPQNESTTRKRKLAAIQDLDPKKAKRPKAIRILEDDPPETVDPVPTTTIVGVLTQSKSTKLNVQTTGKVGTISKFSEEAEKEHKITIALRANESSKNLDYNTASCSTGEDEHPVCLLKPHSSLSKNTVPTSSPTPVEPIEDFQQAKHCNTEDEFEDFDDNVFDEIEFQNISSPSSLSLTQFSPNHTLTTPLRPTVTSFSESPPPPYSSPFASSSQSSLQTPIQPFLRASYPDLLPTAIKDSPMPCLTPSARIRTCFRIADALKTLGRCSSPPVPLPIVELYASIQAIWRDTHKQQIVLADIFFPHQPPYILGILFKPTSSSTPEEATDVFESGALNNGRANDRNPVRVILQSRHVGSARNLNASLLPTTRSQQMFNLSPQRINEHSIRNMLHLDVLDIRRSDWEEVEYVRGIVDPVDSYPDTPSTKQGQTSPQAGGAVKTLRQSGEVFRVHDAFNECFEVNH